MSRRSKPDKRVIQPDVRYQSVPVSFFVHRMMRRGKKSVALRLMYDALDIVKEKTGKEPMEILDTGIEKCRSSDGSKTPPCWWCHIPGSNGSSDHSAGHTLAMRWIIDASRTRAGKSYAEKLATELMDAANNTGSAVKKREETHKMAEANRAFSHYRM